MFTNNFLGDEIHIEAEFLIYVEPCVQFMSLSVKC